MTSSYYFLTPMLPWKPQSSLFGSLLISFPASVPASYILFSTQWPKWYLKKITSCHLCAQNPLIAFHLNKTQCPYCGNIRPHMTQNSSPTNLAPVVIVLQPEIASLLFFKFSKHTLWHLTVPSARTHPRPNKAIQFVSSLLSSLSPKGIIPMSPSLATLKFQHMPPPPPQTHFYFIFSFPALFALFFFSLQYLALSYLLTFY